MLLHLLFLRIKRIPSQQAYVPISCEDIAHSDQTGYEFWNTNDIYEVKNCNQVNNGKKWQVKFYLGTQTSPNPTVYIHDCQFGLTNDVKDERIMIGIFSPYQVTISKCSMTGNMYNTNQLSCIRIESKKYNEITPGAFIKIEEVTVERVVHTANPIEGSLFQIKTQNTYIIIQNCTFNEINANLLLETSYTSGNIENPLIQFLTNTFTLCGDSFASVINIKSHSLLARGCKFDRSWGNNGSNDLFPLWNIGLNSNQKAELIDCHFESPHNLGPDINVYDYNNAIPSFYILDCTFSINVNQDDLPTDRPTLKMGSQGSIFVENCFFKGLGKDKDHNMAAVIEGVSPTNNFGTVSFDTVTFQEFCGTSSKNVFLINTDNKKLIIKNVRFDSLQGRIIFGINYGPTNQENIINNMTITNCKYANDAYFALSKLNNNNLVVNTMGKLIMSDIHLMNNEGYGYLFIQSINSKGTTQINGLEIQNCFKTQTSVSESDYNLQIDLNNIDLTANNLNIANNWNVMLIKSTTQVDVQNSQFNLPKIQNLPFFIKVSSPVINFQSTTFDGKSLIKKAFLCTGSGDSDPTALTLTNLTIQNMSTNAFSAKTSSLKLVGGTIMACGSQILVTVSLIDLSLSNEPSVNINGTEIHNNIVNQMIVDGIFSSLEIKNAKFNSNTGSSDKYLISATAKTSLNILSNTITNNNKPIMIFNLDSTIGQVQISDNVFENNKFEVMRITSTVGGNTLLVENNNISNTEPHSNELIRIELKSSGSADNNIRFHNTNISESSKVDVVTGLVILQSEIISIERSSFSYYVEGITSHLVDISSSGTTPSRISSCSFEYLQPDQTKSCLHISSSSVFQVDSSVFCVSSTVTPVLSTCISSSNSNPELVEVEGSYFSGRDWREFGIHSRSSSVTFYHECEGIIVTRPIIESYDSSQGFKDEDTSPFISSIYQEDSQSSEIVEENPESSLINGEPEQSVDNFSCPLPGSGTYCGFDNNYKYDLCLITGCQYNDNSWYDDIKTESKGSSPFVEVIKCNFVHSATSNKEVHYAIHIISQSNVRVINCTFTCSDNIDNHGLFNISITGSSPVYSQLLFEHLKVTGYCASKTELRQIANIQTQNCYVIFRDIDVTKSKGQFYIKSDGDSEAKEFIVQMIDFSYHDSENKAGDIFNITTSSIELESCKFYKNWANNAGSYYYDFMTIQLASASKSSIKNCEFNNYRSCYRDLYIKSSVFSTMKLEGCKFIYQGNDGGTHYSLYSNFEGNFYLNNTSFEGDGRTDHGHCALCLNINSQTLSEVHINQISVQKFCGTPNDRVFWLSTSNSHIELIDSVFSNNNGQILIGINSPAVTEAHVFRNITIESNTINTAQHGGYYFTLSRFETSKFVPNQLQSINMQDINILNNEGTIYFSGTHDQKCKLNIEDINIEGNFKNKTLTNDNLRTVDIKMNNCDTVIERLRGENNYNFILVESSNSIIIRNSTFVNPATKYLQRFIQCYSANILHDSNIFDSGVNEVYTLVDNLRADSSLIENLEIKNCQFIGMQYSATYATTAQISVSSSTFEKCLSPGSSGVHPIIDLSSNNVDSIFVSDCNFIDNNINWGLVSTTGEVKRFSFIDNSVSNNKGSSSVSLLGTKVKEQMSISGNTVTNNNKPIMIFTLDSAIGQIQISDNVFENNKFEVMRITSTAGGNTFLVENNNISNIEPHSNELIRIELTKPLGSADNNIRFHNTNISESSKVNALTGLVILQSEIISIERSSFSYYVEGITSHLVDISSSGTTPSRISSCSFEYLQSDQTKSCLHISSSSVFQVDSSVFCVSSTVSPVLSTCISSSNSNPELIEVEGSYFSGRDWREFGIHSRSSSVTFYHECEGIIVTRPIIESYDSSQGFHEEDTSPIRSSEFSQGEQKEIDSSGMNEMNPDSSIYVTNTQEEIPNSPINSKDDASSIEQETSYEHETEVQSSVSLGDEDIGVLECPQKQSSGISKTFDDLTIPRYRIDGCSFQDSTWGNTIYLAGGSAHPSVVISNCRFDRQFGWDNGIHYMISYSNSGDLLIEDSSFVNSKHSSVGFLSASIINPNVPTSGNQVIFRNVLIEGFNTIRDTSQGHVLFLDTVNKYLSLRDVIIRECTGQLFFGIYTEGDTYPHHFSNISISQCSPEGLVDKDQNSIVFGHFDFNVYNPSLFKRLVFEDFEYSKNTGKFYFRSPTTIVSTIEMTKVKCSSNVQFDEFLIFDSLKSEITIRNLELDSSNTIKITSSKLNLEQGSVHDNGKSSLHLYGGSINIDGIMFKDNMCSSYSASVVEIFIDSDSLSAITLSNCKFLNKFYCRSDVFVSSSKPQTKISVISSEFLNLEGSNPNDIRYNVLFEGSYDKLSFENSKFEGGGSKREGFGAIKIDTIQATFDSNLENLVLFDNVDIESFYPPSSNCYVSLVVNDKNIRIDNCVISNNIGQLSIDVEQTIPTLSNTVRNLTFHSNSVSSNTRGGHIFVIGKYENNQFVSCSFNSFMIDLCEIRDNSGNFYISTSDIESKLSIDGTSIFSNKKAGVSFLTVGVSSLQINNCVIENNLYDSLISATLIGTTGKSASIVQSSEFSNNQCQLITIDEEGASALHNLNIESNKFINSYSISKDGFMLNVNIKGNLVMSNNNFEDITKSSENMIIVSCKEAQISANNYSWNSYNTHKSVMNIRSTGSSFIRDCFISYIQSSSSPSINIENTDAFDISDSTFCIERTSTSGTISSIFFSNPSQCSLTRDMFSDSQLLEVSNCANANSCVFDHPCYFISQEPATTDLYASSIEQETSYEHETEVQSSVSSGDEEIGVLECPQDQSSGISKTFDDLTIPRYRIDGCSFKDSTWGNTIYLAGGLAHPSVVISNCRFDRQFGWDNGIHYMISYSNSGDLLIEDSSFVNSKHSSVGFLSASIINPNVPTSGNQVIIHNILVEGFNTNNGNHIMFLDTINKFVKIDGIIMTQCIGQSFIGIYNEASIDSHILKNISISECSPEGSDQNIFVIGHFSSGTVYNDALFKQLYFKDFEFSSNSGVFYLQSKVHETEINIDKMSIHGNEPSSDCSIVIDAFVSKVSMKEIGFSASKQICYNCKEFELLNSEFTESLPNIEQNLLIQQCETVSVINSTFVDNKNSSRGITINGKSNIFIKNSLFSNHNETALYVDEAKTTIVESCSFENYAFNATNSLFMCKVSDEQKSIKITNSKFENIISEGSFLFSNFLVSMIEIEYSSFTNCKRGSINNDVLIQNFKHNIFNNCETQCIYASSFINDIEIVNITFNNSPELLKLSNNIESLIYSQCKFTNNRREKYLIEIENFKWFKLDYCTFDSNINQQYDIIHIICENVTVSNCIFHNNDINSNGYSILAIISENSLILSTFVIENVSICNKFASRADIFIKGKQNLDVFVQNCVFNNTCQANKVVYHHDNLVLENDFDITIKNTIFESSKEISGIGAISKTHAETSTISSSVLVDGLTIKGYNPSDNNIIYFDLQMDNLVFKNIHVEGNIGQIFININQMQSNFQYFFKNLTFKDNSYNNIILINDGGGLSQYDAIQIEDLTIERNKGAMKIQSSTGKSIINICNAMLNDQANGLIISCSKLNLSDIRMNSIQGNLVLNGKEKIEIKESEFLKCCSIELDSQSIELFSVEISQSTAQNTPVLDIKNPCNLLNMKNCSIQNNNNEIINQAITKFSITSSEITENKGTGSLFHITGLHSFTSVSSLFSKNEQSVFILSIEPNLEFFEITDCSFIYNKNQDIQVTLRNSKSTLLQSSLISIDKSLFKGTNEQTNVNGGFVNIDASVIDINIQDCYFGGNVAENGGAIYVHASSIDIDFCNFSMNKATKKGSSIYLKPTSVSHLSRCSFQNTQDNNVSSLYIDSNENVFINTSMFCSGNNVKSIESSSPNVFISSSKFTQDSDTEKLPSDGNAFNQPCDEIPEPFPPTSFIHTQEEQETSFKSIVVVVTPNAESEGKNKAGVIAGSVIGAIIVVVLIIVIALLLLKKTREDEPENLEETNEFDQIETPEWTPVESVFNTGVITQPFDLNEDVLDYSYKEEEDSSIFEYDFKNNE